jgi:uncharacterized protein (DUF2236 family)
MRRDDGYFGPGSVTWRVHSSPAIALVGGLRALIVQSLHPLAMAGVDQHSDYRRRPLRRLQRTAEYVATVTFGDTEAADAAARRVRAVHRKVRGIDPVTGRAYSADDPETALWIHAVEVHSFLAAHRVYGRPRLDAREEDRYFAENAIAAELLGVPREIIPQSVGEMRGYFESVRPRLCVSAAAREAIAFVVAPPLTPELAPYWVPMRVLGRAAAALVPRDLRRLAGIQTSTAGNVVSFAQVHAMARLVTLPGARIAVSRALGAGTTGVAREALAA